MSFVYMYIYMCTSRGGALHAHAGTCALEVVPENVFESHSNGVGDVVRVYVFVCAYVLECFKDLRSCLYRTNCDGCFSKGIRSSSSASQPLSSSSLPVDSHVY